MEQNRIEPAHLAHELRAPVTSLRLGLEVLGERIAGRLAPEEARMLALALRGTRRLEGLVDDVMDCAALQAGRLAVAPEPCDARALAEEAVEAMQAAATAKGVRLVKDVAPLLPPCAAEPRRVVQVLVNLLSNAIKFTPARGLVAVSVSEGRGEHAGLLVFKVRDTGRGIPAGNLERVFGMFERTQDAPRTQGTGLGLALARAMVELHGGRIWAESREGAGTSVRFTIPAASADRIQARGLSAAPLEFHGLLAEFGRRVNAFLTLFAV